MKVKLKIYGHSNCISRVQVYKPDDSYQILQSNKGVFNFTCYKGCKVKLFHTNNLQWNFADARGISHYIGTGTYCILTVPDKIKNNEATVPIKDSGFGSWIMLNEATGWITEIIPKLN